MEEIMKSIKHLKMMAAVPALLILFLSVTVAYGGLRWGGIDPTIMVDGHKVDVRIEWPAQHTCTIEDQIEIKFSYPDGSDATLISESSDRFRCDNRVITLSTQTELNEIKSRRLGKNKVAVAALVESSVKMPVKIIVTVDGKIARKCRGSSDELVKCKPVKLGKKHR